MRRPLLNSFAASLLQHLPIKALKRMIVLLQKQKAHQWGLMVSPSTQETKREKERWQTGSEGPYSPLQPPTLENKSFYFFYCVGFVLFVLFVCLFVGLETIAAKIDLFAAA